ncbi:hypothetical protein HDU87_002391 [Geranomyces variabilis]|uniref:Uncharacterized protein n=1 Tax=Geranomyces variabilis TaxID=109894 RepID=A0AAD5TR59_9FUNG|nr:hypothetical protein HDU87_002391 [Geranomyces variabilis]
MSSEQSSALCCSQPATSTTLPHDPSCVNYSRRPRRQTKRARLDDELVDFRLQQELDIARRQSLAINTAPPPPSQQQSSSLSPLPPRASSPAKLLQQIATSGPGGPKKRKQRSQVARLSDAEDASDDSYKARSSKRKRTAAAAKSSTSSSSSSSSAAKEPPAPLPSRRPSNPRPARSKAARNVKTAARARSEAAQAAIPREKPGVVAPSAEPEERQLQHWTAPCAQTYQVSVGGVSVMIGLNSRRFNVGQ